MREVAARANAAHIAVADAFAAELRPLVTSLRAAGVTTLNGLAQELNRRGVKSARGGRWHASSVRNLLARLDQT